MILNSMTQFGLSSISRVFRKQLYTTVFEEVSLMFNQTMEYNTKGLFSICGEIGGTAHGLQTLVAHIFKGFWAP